MDMSIQAKKIQLAAFKMRALNLQDTREGLDRERERLQREYEEMEKIDENLPAFNRKMQAFRRRCLRHEKTKKEFDADWEMFEARFLTEIPLSNKIKKK
jgi:predicted RNase H-like nuclease (RuvC/YqgF family)